MIEKLKYNLSTTAKSRQIRMKCIAVMIVITVAVITLLGCSINTVDIFDGKTTYTVHTLSKNAITALSGVNLKSADYNILNTSVKNGRTTIEIAYTFPVYVTSGDKTTKIEFTSGTVADAIKEAGYTIDEYDFVEPAANTKITKTLYIDYTNIDYVEGSYTEAVPRTTETVYSKDIKKGSESVEEGTDGLQVVSYSEKFVNGVSTESTVTGVTLVSEPVNTIKTIGTGSASASTGKVTNAVTTSASVNCVSTLSPSKPISLDANGVPTDYKSLITARATAYTYTGKNCATGVAPQPGYIAVNPDVIPYGTKMYIVSADGKYVYGYAIAADTGGFTSWSPKGVDLFMTSQSACIDFGVRNVNIYIID